MLYIRVSAHEKPRLSPGSFDSVILATKIQAAFQDLESARNVLS
jgi:hypothetical protein